MERARDALSVAAAATIAALPFVACVPHVTDARCVAPYARTVFSVSVLVERKPLLPIFCTAAATWTVCAMNLLRWSRRILKKATKAA